MAVGMGFAGSRDSRIAHLAVGRVGDLGFPVRIPDKGTTT